MSPDPTVRTLDLFDWTKVQPYLDELLAAELTSATVRPWLQQWSDLAAAVQEMAARVYREVTENTADEAAEERYRLWIEEIKPRFVVAEQALKRKLLDVEGYHGEDDTVVLLRRFRAEASIFRQENVPLESKLALLSNEYNKIVGGLTVAWQGETITVPEAMGHLEDRDRETRAAVWQRITASYAAQRDQLTDLFMEMLSLRRRVAQNAGFGDYRSFRWQQLGRFNYSPEDCFTFHDAIEREVVPLASQLYADLAGRLGIESIRPWDTEVDPFGEPLQPFEDAAELEAVCERIFSQVDPVLGRYFATMRDGYLDLESRTNKALGGYCNGFPVTGKPYIFMNAVGLQDDVSTLLHEGGHAFHFIESVRQPLIWNVDGPIEFCEVASMSMELLASPFLARSQGGFYSERDARRARARDLRATVTFLPYMAVVDAFQHWIYAEAPADVTAGDLDAAWSALWDRFLPGVDFDGLQAEKELRWRRQGHIFEDPFYYVEYGLAQIGALQVWRNALGDQAQAVADYRAALMLGYTRPLPELFQAAGATFAFDRKVVGELMSLIQRQLASLQG